MVVGKANHPPGWPCWGGGADPLAGSQGATSSLLTTFPLPHTPLLPQTPVDEKEAQSVPNIEYLLPNIGRTAAPGEAAGEEQCPWHPPLCSWHRGNP